MSLNTIFLIGAILFAVTSVYFWVVSGNKQFNSPLLVTAVTTISYLVMLQGGLASSVAGNEVVHWTRWVGYMVSCPLLFYVVASGVDSMGDRLTLSGLMALVMSGGALTAVWSGWYFWAGFVFTTFLFIIALVSLYEESDARTLEPVHKYIWLGWVVFPIVFLLAPSGLSIFSSVVAASLYLLLDIYTKIVFYVELAYRQQHSDRGYSAAISGLFR